MASSKGPPSARKHTRVSRVGDIPFAQVLGHDLDPIVMAKIMATDDRLQALESTGVLNWDYWTDELQERTAASRRHHLISGALTVEVAGSDQWTEFGIDVWPASSTGLFVGANVGVSCECQQDHNAHYVRSSDWEVGSDEALAQAFADATAAVEQWYKLGVEPERWLRQAGLPYR